MAYKIPKSKSEAQKDSFAIKKKNPFLKERKIDNPYEIWKTSDGTWEWRVLKKWQIDDDKPYARWFCAVKSPYTYGKFDMGDVYVKDIKENAFKVKEDKSISSSIKAEDKDGKYFLVDIKNKVYDPTPFKTFKDACRINMMLQISTGNDYIVPLTKKDITKHKFKEERLIPK
jgi:hypothetical protein